MKKSEFVLKLDQIQASVSPFLRGIGFKKSGRTHNRGIDDGIVHVINFQMGQYPIGDYIIPGIRESSYGQIAVNLGVYLPCVIEIEQRSEPKRFYQDYHCEIRERLGSPAKSGTNVWWDLREEPDVTGETINDLLKTDGLSFLDRYQNYLDVLDYYHLHGSLPFHNEGRSALTAAMIYSHLGKNAEASTLFDRAAADAVRSGHAGFHDYVHKIRQRCLGNTIR